MNGSPTTPQDWLAGQPAGLRRQERHPGAQETTMARPMMTRPNRAQLDQQEAARAGCVRLRVARATRTVVGVYRSDEAGWESDPDLPWTTVCEEHSALVCHSRRVDADRYAAHPDDWCEDCRTLVESGNVGDAAPRLSGVDRAAIVAEIRAEFT